MRRLGFIAVALVAAAFVAFGPALRAPFDFDDRPAITDNASIYSLRPSAGLILGSGTGSPVDGRPVVAYSFAINEAINRALGMAPGEDTPRATLGFHLLNVVLHAATAFLLFLLVRSTLRYARLSEHETWASNAEGVALVVAFLWLLHPIQTEAVDYVTQRTEILVSLFYLATIYWATVVLFDADGRARVASPRVWTAMAAIAAALGAGSKEVIVTAPLVLAAYDRAFIASSWSSILGTRARKALYSAITIAVAVPLALLAALGRGGTAGFSAGVSWYQYLYTQAWAVAHYVKLLFWPGQLAFDYGRNLIGDASAMPQFAVLAAVLAATIFAWTKPRWHWLAFLGSCFFLVLAPSSSVLPIRTEIAAERRVYLASAAIIVLAVIAVEYVRRLNSRAADGRTASTKTAVVIGVGVLYAILSGWTARHASRFELNPWLFQAIVGVIASVVTWAILFGSRSVQRAGLAVVFGGLAMTTYRRSAVYDDLVERWTDAVEKTPTNGRAYDNLASALLRDEPPRIASADSVLHLAMRMDSSFVPARVRAATIAFAQGRLVDAETLLTRALAIHPRDAAATEQIGKVLIAQRRPEDALPYLRQMADFRPNGETLTQLGLAFTQLRQLDSARAAFTRATELAPWRADAPRNLAAILVEQDRGAEAVPYIERAIAIERTDVSLGLASLAYAQAGKSESAEQAASDAAAAAQNNAIVYVLAGRAMLRVGRLDRAREYLTHAVSLKPTDPQALSRLAALEVAAGNRDVARRLYQRALESSPGYPLAQQGLDGLASGARRE